MEYTVHSSISRSSEAPRHSYGIRTGEHHAGDTYSISNSWYTERREDRH